MPEYSIQKRQEPVNKINELEVLVRGIKQDLITTNVNVYKAIQVLNSQIEDKRKIAIVQELLHQISSDLGDYE